MKPLFLFYFFFLLCNNLANAQQTPTFADPPGPENVLVVYKVPIDEFDELGQISEAIKDYYQTARNIPASNILGLESLVNDDIFDPLSNTTHRIEITQDGEIISDGTILSYDPINRHSWRYFVKKIAEPIADHLQF